MLFAPGRGVRSTGCNRRTSRRRRGTRARRSPGRRLPTAAARSRATRSRPTSGRRSDADNDHRQPSRDQRDDHRADERHHLHVQGRSRPTPTATGPPSAASNPITPTSASPPSAPQNVSASPATSQALVTWTAPASNGGSPITSYTITPYIGATAQTPVRWATAPRRAPTVDRPDQRHRLHVHRHGDQQRRHRSGIDRLGRGHARRTRSSTSPAHPRTSTPATRSSVELGVKFTADTSGQVTGIRFYKATRQHRHPHRQPLDRRRPAARPGHLHRRDRLGLADGHLRHPRRDLRRHHLRRRLPRPQRPLLRDPRRARPAQSTTRRCTPSPTAPAPTASTPTARPARSPPTPSTPTTTGSTSSSTRLQQQPAGPADQRDGVSAAGVGICVVDGAHRAAGACRATRSRRTRAATAQPPVTVSGTTTTTTVPGLIPDQSYTFVVQASNTAGSGPASAPSNAITPTPATAPSAPQNVAATPATGQAS